MEDLLAHPAFQAAVAPFGAALALAAALRRTRLLGIAVGAAFLLVIGLTIGFAFEALTAMRKLVLVGLATTIAIPVLELTDVQLSAKWRAGIAAVAGGAGVWIVSRVLLQKSPPQVALGAVGAALYVGLLVESSLQIAGNSIQTAAASTLLGLSVGALAILGSSAVLGQVGIALAAGAGAVLIVLAMRTQSVPTGWTLALPPAIIGGNALLAVVATGTLPWYCLAPTLAIAWVARLARPSGAAAWRTAAVAAAAALVPAVIAVALAWFAPHT